jgi:hypothetical protein
VPTTINRKKDTLLNIRNKEEDFDGTCSTNGGGTIGSCKIAVVQPEGWRLLVDLGVDGENIWKRILMKEVKTERCEDASSIHLCGKKYPDQMTGDLLEKQGVGTRQHAKLYDETVSHADNAGHAMPCYHVKPHPFFFC